MMTFLQINLLLVISYLLFFGVQKIERLFKFNSSHNLFLRCAQFLVILSLSAPVLMKFVPVKKLPTYQSHFPVVSEYDESKLIVATNKFNSFVKSAPTAVKIDQKSMSIDYKMILIVLYAIGFIYFFVKLAINYLKLKKLLDNATVFKQTKKLKIVVSDTVTVPFSVKMLWLYWVVIPVDLLNYKNDLSFAIRHELQHHRQGDTVWAVFIEILTCVLFFNPTIYLWKSTIIEFQEFSCDESLTGQEDILSHDYGSCLLRVAETALTNRQTYAGTTSMAAVFKNSKYFKTFLLRRIEMIVKGKKSTSKWVPICTGIVIALCTITFSYGVEKVLVSKTSPVNLEKLILDEDIQKIANDSLEKALKDPQFSAGFVIVSNPNTGKILAVANIDKKMRLKNHWALSQLFEPASIGKTFIIAEALDKNLTTPETPFKCENGKYKYKGRIYYDWKDEGFNELTTTQTLASSSNSCSMKIAEIVGSAGLKAMTEKFGFGT
ncbi:MAG: hypothetical protein K2Q18_17060, partial [Bdellovibrionales bacterium]|nr:hypothetical protein [Bdellovibrionales bacterium]